MMVEDDPYLGGKITLGDKPKNIDPEDIRTSENYARYRRGETNRDGAARKWRHEATKWKNRRPICPYGCGQEGVLTEIVVVPGRGAMGYYKDSEQLIFTAPMKMQPKPSSKKLVIGPDGEPQLVTEEA